MTSITWAGPRCVQEAATFLGPQNRTQGRCEMVFLSISISMECGGGGDIASGAVHRCLLFTTSTLREQFWNILYFEVFRSTFLLTKYLISRFNITDLSVLRVDKIFIIINKRYYVKSGWRIRSTLNRVL